MKMANVRVSVAQFLLTLTRLQTNTPPHYNTLLTTVTRRIQRGLVT